MSVTVDLIKRYLALEREFRVVLTAAGGDPEIILAQDAWLEVLATLASNNIGIKAEYLIKEV